MANGRHLINEIRAELDWTESEISRIHDQIAEIDREYARRLAHVGAASPDVREAFLKDISERRKAEVETLGLVQLYALQNRAAQRFSRLTRVYEVGCATESAELIRETLGKFLFRAGDDYTRIPGAPDALNHLSAALFRYFNGSLNDETDQSIRDAWLSLEGVFAALGRKT